MLRYVLGLKVGAGGKTDALIADETGGIVGHGRLQGAGSEALVEHTDLRALLEEAILGATHGYEGPAFRLSKARIHLPVPGLDLPQLLNGPILKDFFESLEDCQANRCSIAATGALGKSYAGYNVVTLVAGIGSMGWACASDGRTADAGGWGAALGDRGCGHSIATRAIGYALQAQDGLIEPTSLAQRALDYFGLEQLGDLRAAPDRKTGIPRILLSGFAKEVFASAAGADLVAIRLLNEEADYMARLAGALVGRLGIRDNQVYVIPSGGIWRGEGEFVKTFTSRLAELAPKATILKPRFDPVVGAVLEALYALGVNVSSDVICRLRDSLPDQLSAQ